MGAFADSPGAGVGAFPAGGVPFCSCRKEPKDTLKGEAAGRASRLGGLPLKNPPLRESQIGGWVVFLPARSGYGRGGPCFRCRCLGIGIEGWVGSILDAPGWRVVLAGRPLIRQPAAMPPYYDTAESWHKPSPF